MSVGEILTDKLDQSLYSLNDDELIFFKRTTMIDDEQKLKEHILAVQREAYEIFPYPCIQGFRFLNMKISRFPVYKDVLALGKERKGAILLDMACCFGNDARKAAMDGFPADQIVASDLRQGFWDAGHKLFRDDSTSLPITFTPGDIFNDEFLSIDGSPGPTIEAGKSITYPTLRSLRLTDTLNPLKGKISAIHASSFFHLFDEKKQAIVAHKLATLLSPEPGSVIFGSHSGTEVKGERARELRGTVFTLFSHTPESFKELWEKEVFTNGEVIVEAKNIERGREIFLNVWSVRRV